MTVAVVHTRNSPCLCHRAVLDALASAGLEGREIDCDTLPEAADRLRGCRFAFDQSDTYRGTGDRFRVAEILWAAGLEVIGSPPAKARLLDDKRRAREALARAGLPLPATGTAMGWPRIVKSSGFHGSRGVRLVHTPAEEEDARRGECVVEEFVPGREVAVAVVGRRRPRALPPVEVRIAGPIYTEHDKWSEANPAVVRAELPREAVRALERATAELGLRDFARFDLRVRPDGRWIVLEVNVRPSLEPEGLLCAAASFEGLSAREVSLGLLAGAGGPGRCPWD